MSTEQQKKTGPSEGDEKIVKIVRTLARSIGPILFLVMLTLAIGQGGMDRLISLTGTETICFICILTMFFGILWTYTHEIAGGILIIVGYIVLAIVMKSPIPGTVYPIFFILGCLHIYCGLMELKFNRYN